MEMETALGVHTKNRPPATLSVLNINTYMYIYI